MITNVYDIKHYNGENSTPSNGSDGKWLPLHAVINTIGEKKNTQE